MKVYTYSEARQRLASLLEEAKKSGAVRIRRRDGQCFILKPERMQSSPLNVEGMNLKIPSEEIVEFLVLGAMSVPQPEGCGFRGKTRQACPDQFHGQLSHAVISSGPPAVAVRR